ncbi:hypothetical protein [Mycolicibacterium peregrinum]|uniref:Uncharacterized protein n=1 Tax=Mycolicibacterium peregrinum TaxID=43304 RepID=A0A4Z0HHT3_MYCPR|nr:hypothetical protein [Mycolicibacterium peregrinum]TGB37912.1 hypothetical protein EJD98_25520 [Mycolicibacterium peregrinum]TGB38069.1 hypothetical protein EJD94_25045 [Mycolicibacterium peregrinum]
MTAVLSEDQRWLLYVAARHVMPIALIDPDYGIRELKASHAGGCWPPGRARVPEWLNSYQVTKSGIAGGEAPGLTRVTVTWGQLTRFAQELPVELRSVLMEARKADRNNVDDAMFTVLGLAATAPRQLGLFEVAL